MTDKDFSKWINNEYIPNNPEYQWIKDVSSKSVKQSMKHAYTAFKRFFQQKSGFPKFKKKGVSESKMYFVKNNLADCQCERHRLKIPTLGWVRLKEKGYIPTTKQGCSIKSGTVSMKAGRYYVSVIIELPDVKTTTQNTNKGIGIDLGLRNFAILSNGIIYKNINQTKKTKKLEKQLRRAQRCLSRKQEHLKKQNLKEGETTQRKNIQKQKRKIQRLYRRLTNIRTDYINKTIQEIVKTKPSYLAIEDLNISGMMKNYHLAKAIAAQKFYEFRTKLQQKCKEHGIAVRIVDRFYASSKTCHHCGQTKKDLKLLDRTFRCPHCGYEEDRDYNASLNLRDTTAYRLA